MRIYTDGATSNNGYADARGGWAWVIIEDKNDECFVIDSGAGLVEENATNNICELMAVIDACAHTKSDTSYTVYSDSAYIINCYKQKWYKKWQQNGWITSKKQPVANKELWEQLIPYFENQNFNFTKVLAHVGNKFNEMVDKMAVAAREGD